MSDNASLVYELEAQIGKFASSFEAATKTANASFDQITSAGRDAGNRIASSIGSAVQSVTTSLSSLKGPAKQTGDMIGALIGGGIIAVAAGLATTMTELINALASAGDRADDLRLPVNILQALKIAADEARVPVDKLNSALDQFTKVSKQSADDSKPFYTALNNIGPTLAHAFQQAPTQAERLRVLMDAFRATTDEVKRAQLAQEAFGSDNERLISMFAGGRDAMEGYIAEIRKLGLEIDESAVKRAQEAKSALSLLAAVMTDELSTALAELIPSFKEFLPLLESVAGYVRDTVAGFASPENRPLATLKNDAKAAEEQVVELQAHLKELDDYKPQGQVFGVDVAIAKDKTGAFKGIGFDVAADRKRTEEEIAKLKADLEKYDQLIADKQKQENARPKGKYGAEKPAFKPRPSLTKDDESKTFDKAVSSANRHAAAMEADAVAVGMAEEKHQQLRAEVELLNAAKKDGAKVTNDQIDAYARLRASMGEQQALAAAGITLTGQQAAAFDQVSTHVAAAAKALSDAKDKFQGVNDALRYAGSQLVDVFDKATQRGANFRLIMLSVLKDVEKQLMEAAIMGGGSFAKLIPGVAGEGGGVGGLLGGLAKLFGGARAGGGDVSPDKAYLIGERGPEVMIPKNSGRIIPHNQIALGGGSRNNVTHNNVVNVNVSGGNGGGDAHANQDLAEKVGRAVNDQMQRMTMNAIRQQLKPGGILYG